MWSLTGRCAWRVHAAPRSHPWCLDRACNRYILLAIAVGRPRALILLPLVASLLYLALPEPVLKRAATTFELRDTATRERLEMFGSGIAMARDNPILGLGPGLVQPAYTDYRRGGTQAKIPHLHNNVIQITAERGLAGLADLSGSPLCIWPVRRGERFRPHKQ